MSIDTETHDPDLKKLGPGPRRGGYIVGYSFAIEDGPQAYVPIRHQEGGNVDVGEALRYLRAQAEVFTGELVGANLQYDLDFLLNEGVEFRNISRVRDVQLADPLINELQDSYSLAAIAKRRNLPAKEEQLLRGAAAAYGVDPKTGLYLLPGQFVGEYAEQDAALPLLVYRDQIDDIEEQELWQVFNLECDVLPVLLKMRRHGVRIDLEHLQRIEDWSIAEETKACKLIKDKTGYNLALGDCINGSHIAPVLESLGVYVRRKANKSRQPVGLTDEYLKSINHEVVDAIRRARKVNKIRTTFVNSLRRYMIVNPLTGEARIHCSYNQLRATDEGDGSEKGAAFGRLSSEDPNLQQQPARDPEIGPFWRKVYVPDEGKIWASLDYSQQEPRMAVHFAALTKLGNKQIAGKWVDIDAASMEAVNAYRNDPNCDNHQMMADMAGIKRKDAKGIYLGLSYGMGGAKLCRQLGLPTRFMFRYTPEGGKWGEAVYGEDESALGSLARTMVKEKGGGVTQIWEVAGEEGQALLDKFSQRVPFIPEMAKRCQEAAKQRGYIKTLSGRRCRFPIAADGSFDWCHKAFNRLIQGSSADQTKEAMVKIAQAGYELQLQVHDEFDLSVVDRAEAERIAEIMVNCVTLQVPSKVDIELGPSWGEVK